MLTATEIDNPYWDAVKDHVDPVGSLWRTPSVGGLGLYRTGNGPGDIDFDRWGRTRAERRDYVGRYSWTIPDPDTLAFVAEHSRGRLVDPMAGTGYWARLLTGLGVDVVCYDLAPGTNTYHNEQPLHFQVAAMDAAEAVALHPDRTLFLSWPPMDDAGTRTVRAYTGDRVIFIGEGDGGCTGDEDLFAEFGQHWVEVADRVPVQWDGLHDVVTVYDRKERRT